MYLVDIELVWMRHAHVLHFVRSHVRDNGHLCQDKLHCKYVVSFLVSFFCESHILVLVYVREVIKSC